MSGDASIRPDVNAAEVLCRTIERHRDEKWNGDPVEDALDLTLYTAAVWYRTEYPGSGP